MPSLADTFGQAAGVGPAAASAPAPKARGGTAAAQQFNALHPRTAKGRVGGGRFAKKGEVAPAATGPVKTLERNLSALGFSPDAKGVADFQKSRGLKVTGKFDATTERAFRNAVYAAAASGGEQKRTAVAPVEKDIAERTKALQGRLDAAGFIVGSSGTWSQRDDDALKAFQKREGIAPSPARVAEDGSVILDPETTAALARFDVRGGADSGRGGARGGRSAASRGSEGERSGGADGASGGSGGSSDVAYARMGDGMGRDAGPDPQTTNVQERLDSLGFELGDGGVDGQFGPDTRDAVKKFQEQSGLKATGVVDEDTWYALTKASAERESRTRRGEVSLSADEPAGDYSRGSRQAHRARRLEMQRRHREGVAERRARVVRECARWTALAAVRELSEFEAAEWREADRERRVVEVMIRRHGDG